MPALDDPELRRILRSEGHERLAAMEAALLRLEVDAKDAEALDALFREAHSLKGAARMAGLDELGAKAHAMEDGLQEARAKRSLGKRKAAAMLRTLDAMRAMLDEATADAPARLPVPAPASPAASPAEPPIEVKPWQPARAAPRPPPAPVLPRTAIEDAMRVETRHLDTILNHVAELAVVRRRMGRRLEEMTRLVQQWRRDGLQEAADALDVLHAEGSEDYARLATTASTLDETIQQVRLVALHTAMGPLQRVVRDVAAETGKRAHFVVEGGETRLDRRVLDGLRDTLMHLVRNAVDHGLEPPDQRLAHGKVDIGLVRIRAYPDGANVVVEVEDDGRGFDLDAIRASAVAKGLVPAGEVERAPPERVLEYVFLPGFSTAKRVTGISGRGVGLDVVREAVQKLKGTVHLDNRPGRGSVVRLRVPARTGAARVLLVRIAARAYAIPIDAVERVERAKKGAVATPLAHVLELPGATPAVPGQALLALASGGETANVLVDDVLHEQEVVLRPHSALLRRVRNVMGATILDSGEVCIVLNPDDVLRALRRGVERKPRVLVVDDSASAREGIAAALRAAGYETTTAKNGLEALALLGGGGPLAFDAVVTDVEMPGMDGLALTRRLRDDPATTRLPIVMVTSLGTDEARQRGRKAGADGYVVKGADAGERVVQELRAALVRGQVT